MAVNTVKATINGTEYNLTFNSTTGNYEATITAPSKSSFSQSGNYYDVTVRATDTAGNVTTKNATDATLGNNLKLYVKEKVAPTITITAPTAGATLTNNKPAITFTVVDSDSGVNPDTIKLTIDSTVITTGITKTVITNGYNCSYTPATALADGSHAIKVDASDNDGNAAAQKTVSVKVDTAPPTLSVSAPVAGLITNITALTVKGTTNDAVSSPVAIKITLNSSDVGAVTVDGSGNFEKSLTLAAGSNTIVVTATDGAGKISTVTRNVTLDTVAPTITSVSITPNPVDSGATFVISVAVTD